MPATARRAVDRGPDRVGTNAFGAMNRRRLSAPAPRTFLAIADLWGLTEEQRRLLLGLPSRSTYHAWARATRSDMTLRESLAFLASREIARRDERRIMMASKLAQFPFMRELGGFDFDAQPSLDPRQIRELATCRWIAHGDTTLFLGPPGTGKSHLAVALGREAIRQNFSVQFVTAATLVAMLAKAQSDGTLDKQLTILSRPKLLIIDELGYLPFETHAAHLFFQLVSRRYEKGSILITSNRSVGEWGSGVFGDPVVATATLDRLLHHSTVITIRGDSYRLREKRRSGLLQKAGATETNPTAQP